MSSFFVLIIFLILFAIVLVAISFGFRFLESQRKKQVEGMLKVVSGQSPETIETTILVDPHAAGNRIETLLKNTTLPNRINQMIQQSGLPWTLNHLLAAMVISAVVGAAIGAIFRPLGFFSLSMLVPAFLLASTPYLFLRYKSDKRMAEFEEQLPEALDFLARSMRAGHAFSISLEMLGAESPDPLGQEFRVLFNELNLGAPLETALANFARRVPLLDIRLFVSSVLLQRQTGGNLSEIMVRLAYVIRERFRLKGQVRAASAHGRLTALVLTILPIVLVFAFLFVAPGYLQGMAADPDGKYMILGAVLAQALGYYTMRRITDIQV